MMQLIHLYNQIFAYLYKYTDDIFKLFLRLYAADGFFRSGLTKLGSWDSELPFLSSDAQYLFENEYQVPLIPWELAAYLGTATELILPVFLILGLATRLMAVKLFVFNVVAVVSYLSGFTTLFPTFKNHTPKHIRLSDKQIRLQIIPIL
ncbi:Rhomboid family protein [uncultured Gammaproteobacteria bacterium]|nr:Rhomboid family protein [uncultured Gammaproteobacteria bacterium]